MGCTLYATAQNYSLRIYSGNNETPTNQWSTANISSITHNGGVATFTVNGSSITKNFSEIDYITFYSNAMMSTQVSMSSS